MTAGSVLDGVADQGIRAVTLWKLPDGRWQGSVSRDGVGWSCQHGETPEQALALALNPRPPKPDNGGIFD